MDEAKRNAERLFAGLDRISRRELLRRAGRGSVYLGVGALLAACGIGGQNQQTGGGNGQDAEPSPEPLPEAAGTVSVANWPLYIDRIRGKSPTLASFTEDTGTQIDYKVVINDNEEFFGTIQEPLSRGESVGWDVIVVTDWMVAKMVRLGFLRELDHDRLPQFEANAFDKFRDPPYDPGNTYSIPWAAGITGIGYDVSLTGRELTSMEDLFDPAFEGHVGMFSEMRDTIGLILLSMGVVPTEAGIDDVEAAQQRLLQQRDDGIVRGYYGNDYTDGLANGDLWATMAWSGDIFALQQDNPNLRFVIPDEGAMRWTDNMCIPAPAEHPTDAHVWMDYVYTPRIATNITEWVWYESPVSQVPEMIETDAAEASGADKALLEELAASPLVFPDETTVATTYNYKVLDEEEEAAWNELFQQVTQG
ncbi:MAG TPA: spermidine/putrescine ABC transporter substrate-binding protein [Actinomycetota bacterium]|jgi:spermidine/putrescine transport system substrate-binding protein|nr:spermidine/putrescine ABC transporter substrate-binding protein [Actinomycetota bacterium]